jgi:hypothetical protein
LHEILSQGTQYKEGFVIPNRLYLKAKSELENLEHKYELNFYEEILLDFLRSVGVEDDRARFLTEVLYRSYKEFTPFDADSESNKHLGALASFAIFCAFESGNFAQTTVTYDFKDLKSLLQDWPKLTIIDDKNLRQYIGNPQLLASVLHAGLNGNGNGLSLDGWRYRPVGWIKVGGKKPIVKAVSELISPKASMSSDHFTGDEMASRVSAWYLFKEFPSDYFQEQSKKDYYNTLAYTELSTIARNLYAVDALDPTNKDEISYIANIMGDSVVRVKNSKGIE